MLDIERSDIVSKLIVIEGAVDGIGKSTQFNLLKKELEKENIVISHHFPTYDEYQGKPVMEYLKGNFGKPDELSPYFINSLYALDRIITWNKKLKPIYDNDGIVLLDRYTTSSLIYQSALIDDIEEKNKFLDYVIDYEYNKLGIKEPDLVIFLTAPFDLVAKLRNTRLEESGEQIEGDIHERDIEFMKKVYDNSMYCAKYFNWTIIDCTDNDKFDSIENIHEKIKNVVLKR